MGLDVLIAGAGAIGSVLALRLVNEGAKVRLLDPAASGDNASGVAAGMLTPAFEAALDPISTTHFPLLKQARDLWPALAEDFGAEDAIDRSGALWVGEAASQVEVLGSLQALGASAEAL